MSQIQESPYQPPSENLPSQQATVGNIVSTILLVLAGSLLVFLVFCMGPFAWLLRDGLGPDSTASAGWDAVTRTFWCLYWGPATVFISLIVAVLFFVRR